jgi:hypothetical protein
MYRRFCLLGACFMVFAGAALRAEDASPGLPGFRGRAVVLDIDARVVEQNQAVTWNESHQRQTIAGSPVGIKLVGANVVVAVQFTPYLRRMGPNVLVAQGQIWVEIPEQGIRYHTSIQTIPLEFDEPIYFFPLGSVEDENNARIEIMLTMRRLPDSEIPPESTASAPEHDR